VNEIGQLTRRETGTEVEAGTSTSTSAGTGVGPPDAEEAGQVDRGGKRSRFPHRRFTHAALQPRAREGPGGWSATSALRTNEDEP
jgi:hypothetical protein